MPTSKDSPAAPKNGWLHVRKEDVRQGSALTVDPPFASFDVVHRCDYEALQRERDDLEHRLRAALWGEKP